MFWSWYFLGRPDWCIIVVHFYRDMKWDQFHVSINLHNCCAWIFFFFFKKSNNNKRIGGCQTGLNPSQIPVSFGVGYIYIYIFKKKKKKKKKKKLSLRQWQTIVNVAIINLKYCFFNNEVKKCMLGKVPTLHDDCRLVWQHFFRIIFFF